MCGISGIISATEQHDAPKRKFFTQALIATAVRGDDGTGAFFVRHNAAADERADWVKNDATPQDLIASEEGKKRLGTQAWYNRYRAVIGHNRAATRGGVSHDNSHPFSEGPITLVHNGGLLTHTLPTGMAKLPKAVTVDSHVLAHNLALHDTETVLRSMAGSFAIIWHDARDQSVNIFRNEERPLAMAECHSLQALLICSEADMLRWLARRNELAISSIYSPRPGAWLKFLPGAGLVPTVKTVALHRVSQSYGGYYVDGADYDYSSSRARGRRSESAATRPFEMPRPSITPRDRKGLRALAIEPEGSIEFTPVAVEEGVGQAVRITGFVTATDGAVLSAELFRPKSVVPQDLDDTRWMVWPLRPAPRESDTEITVTYHREVFTRSDAAPTRAQTRMCTCCHRVASMAISKDWLWDHDLNGFVCFTCDNSPPSVKCLTHSGAGTN